MSGALPASPGRWFSDDELRRSAAYHDPLRRAARLGDTAVVAAGVGLAVADPSVSVTALAMGLVVVARAVLGDVVMDRVAEPSLGHAPLPGTRLLVSSLVGALAQGLAVAALVLAIDQVASSHWWWWAAALAVVAVLAGAGLADRWFDLVHRPHPVSDDSFADRAAALADELGVARPEFQVTSSPAFVGPTALTLGVGRPRVVATGDLVVADERLRDWVLAHELTHVARGDVRRGRVLTVASAVVSILAVAAAGATLDRPGSRGALVIVGVLVVVRIIGHLWLSAHGRDDERRADDGAAALLGPQASVVRALVSGPRARLDPTWWERITAAHPTPAERIRRLS